MSQESQMKIKVCISLYHRHSEEPKKNKTLKTWKHVNFKCIALHLQSHQERLINVKSQQSDTQVTPAALISFSSLQVETKSLTEKVILRNMFRFKLSWQWSTLKLEPPKCPST